MSEQAGDAQLLETLGTIRAPWKERKRLTWGTLGHLVANVVKAAERGICCCIRGVCVCGRLTVLPVLLSITRQFILILKETTLLVCTNPAIPQAFLARL